MQLPLGARFRLVKLAKERKLIYMSGKPKMHTVQLSKWPEHLLPWKKVRAKALEAGKTVTQYVFEAVQQRYKGGW